MNLRGIASGVKIEERLDHLLDTLHRQGPISQALLEELSLIKRFHPDVFGVAEEKVIAAMGLFYKIKNPNSLYAFLLKRMGTADVSVQGQQFTPVQSSLLRAIESNQFISISAPTSAGKSFSVREFISTGSGDAVVVVPSRALIAEYMSAMRREFDGNREVMISSFVDRVYTARTMRRIFVLTPERSRDLFGFIDELDISIFFFDEAQISEEPSRGVIFDVLVRRIRKSFPRAKLIFAHPFIENPEAQLEKHRMEGEGSFSRNYRQGSVGKIYLMRHSNGKDYYFSPFEDSGHLLKNCVAFDGGFENFAFSPGHSILVYVTKGSIYSGKFLEGFEKWINGFEEVNSEEGKRIIERIEEIVGADEDVYKSRLVALLRKGVVIHHGSVPLEVRFLLEDFVRLKLARVCFATSTLVQGVNMPFDIVWLGTMKISGDDYSQKSLAFKNLIGRAGRLTSGPEFDYGYVYTMNPEMLGNRIADEYFLSPESRIDAVDDDCDVEGVSELLEAIREGSFDDDLNLPESKIERLADDGVLNAIREVLDLVYGAGTQVQSSLAGNSGRQARDRIESLLRFVYERSLGRALFDGEAAVFRQAILLMLQVFQGRSFSEIAATRFNRISKRDAKRIGKAVFGQAASVLPDSRLIKAFPFFPDGTLARDVSYDAVVFDTYDYLDKVVSFSLTDTFVAAFKIFKRTFADVRADWFVDLLRFGTNDSSKIMMLRYGFQPEEIEAILPYVRSISQEKIVFFEKLKDAPLSVRRAVDWYL
jgi:helicase